MNLPNPPWVNGPLMAWLKRVHEAVQARTIISSSGYKVRRRTGGFALEFEPGRGGGISIGTHVYIGMTTDFLICRTFDGAHAGANDVYIAKPPLLRFSIKKEFIDNQIIDYTNYDDNAQIRHAKSPFYEEDQVITPRYVAPWGAPGINFPGSLIYAIPCKTMVNDPDGKPLGLMDMNVDAREWTQYA